MHISWYVMETDPLLITNVTMKYKIGMYDNAEQKEYMYLTLNLDFLIIMICSRCTLFIYKNCYRAVEGKNGSDGSAG